MSPKPRPGSTTYLIEIRDGSKEHVRSTLKKYYDDLLTDVVRNPADCDDVLLVTTSHELPPDAFRRYVEVDDVVLTDIAIRDWSPESVEDGCADVVSDFPDTATVSLAVNRWGTMPNGDGIRRPCKDALCATGLVVDCDRSEETEIQIDIIGDWAGISLKR